MQHLATSCNILHVGRELIKSIVNDNVAANHILGGLPSADLAVKVRVYARQMVENQVWRRWPEFLGRFSSLSDPPQFLTLMMS